MSKERVLITGAAGFLGSHLCERFLKEGYHVIGMDNLITGDLRNIEHLFPQAHFEFHNHDVSQFVETIICAMLVKIGRRPADERSGEEDFKIP